MTSLRSCGRFFSSSVLAFVVLGSAAFGGEPELAARWPLGAGKVPTASEVASTARDLKETLEGPVGGGATVFNGRTSVIEAADSPALRLGRGNFTATAWVNSAASGHETPGDIISQYDPETRTGFHLGLYTHAGVTNSQPNRRQLHFGIDQGRIEDRFRDHGRLGSGVFVFAMCVHDGQLYASTCEAGDSQVGHVYRFEGGDRWTDLGSPDKANSISAMATFDGQLYVASSKYRLGGSALTESTNANFGGRVFRLGPKDEWIDCGSLSPETEAVSSLIDFRGRLYAASLYKPAGFFRYDGDQKWTPVATPDGKRVEATTVFNGSLYATCYDEGSVYRFDGENWELSGKIPDATQTYGFGVHGGELFVSEWPQAHVFRLTDGGGWVDTGKLGMEQESMPLLMYNGKLYCGTLPLAEVYRFDGPERWTRIGQVDHTPDVRFRRAWSMAVFQGRLFVGTLPAGRVMSIEAGRNVTYDRELPPGWHHVAAVRDSRRLKLFVDGEQVAESAEFTAEDYDLTNGRPLRIGAGAQDHFDGTLSDVRLYRGALTAEQIREIAKP